MGVQSSICILLFASIVLSVGIILFLRCVHNDEVKRGNYNIEKVNMLDRNVNNNMAKTKKDKKNNESAWWRRAYRYIINCFKKVVDYITKSPLYKLICIVVLGSIVLSPILIYYISGKDLEEYKGLLDIVLKNNYPIIILVLTIVFVFKDAIRQKISQIKKVKTDSVEFDTQSELTGENAEKEVETQKVSNEKSTMKGFEGKKIYNSTNAVSSAQQSNNGTKNNENETLEKEEMFSNLSEEDFNLAVENSSKSFIEHIVNELEDVKTKEKKIEVLKENIEELNAVKYNNIRDIFLLKKKLIELNEKNDKLNEEIVNISNELNYQKFINIQNNMATTTLEVIKYMQLSYKELNNSFQQFDFYYILKKLYKDNQVKDKISETFAIINFLMKYNIIEKEIDEENGIDKYALTDFGKEFLSFIVEGRYVL